MKYKIGVIGRYGANSDMCDGQTVKTKNLIHLMEKEYGIPVFKVDTYYFRKNNVKLIFDTLICMFCCDHVFLMVSVNGMNFYLRVLYYLNKITRKHIYHYIIGSELLEMVAANPKLVKYLNALDANWFEYGSGAHFLREKGVNNVSTLPNFKMLTPVREAERYMPCDGKYGFCTFSRVMEEKGITDAIHAIANINERLGHTVAILDIYGPVEASYENEFKKLVSDHSDCVCYKGVADSQKSVEILKNYYALLFPTRWPGEGFPGTIIDAFASGVPVIASDWNANKEIVQEGKQGIIYPGNTVETLENAIMWSLENREDMMRMRTESRRAFEKFTPKTIGRVIMEELSKNGLVCGVN